MKSVWVYAPTPSSASWFEALAPSLAEASLEPRRLPAEAVSGGLAALTRALADTRETGGLLCVGERDDPALSDLNRACRASALPLLLVSPSAHALQVGPGVVFGTSPCLACLENHNKFMPLDESSAAAATTETLTETTAPRATRDAPHAPPELVAELVAFLDARADGLLRRGYVFRAAAEGGAAQRFRVLKNPTCLVCSVFAEHPTESTRINT